MKKGLFLDFDGTLRQTRSGKVCPSTPDDIVLLPHVKEVLHLVKKEYQLVGISNQGGIGLGFMSSEKADACFKETLRQLDLEFPVLFCPHAPRAGCDCRKPKPGMAIRAQNEFGIVLADSTMVGDMKSDQAFSRHSGIGTFTWARDFFSPTQFQNID